MQKKVKATQKTLCMFAIISLVSAAQQKAYSALPQGLHRLRYTLPTVGLCILKTQSGVARHTEPQVDDVTLTKKLFIGSAIARLSRNSSPSYGVDEEYNAWLTTGEWICCQRLSRTNSTKEVTRCSMSTPSEHHSVPLSSIGFDVLRALHNKELDKQGTFREHLRALAGLPSIIKDE